MELPCITRFEQMLGLSLKQHHCGGVYVCCANGFWFSSHPGNFCFGKSACTLQFMRPVFLYFFQKFPKLGLAALAFSFRAVLFNLFVITEPLLYFSICHRIPINKNFKNTNYL